MDDYEHVLRKLSVRDDRYIESILSLDGDSVEASGLDPKAQELVRLGALIAVNAASPSYMSAVESAVAAGASAEEVVGTLVAVMPAVGVPRVVSAAPKLGLALGYDVGEALEAPDEPGRR